MIEPASKRMIVQNRSARLSGTSVGAICLHTAEFNSGACNEIYELFNDPATEASAHIIIDTDGETIRCVEDEDKAWTCLLFNSLTLNIELVGFASQTKDFWLSERNDQLVVLSHWIKYWSDKFDIPIQRGVVDHGPKVLTPGIIGHADITNLGYGDHTDPGEGFPYDRLIELAKSP